MIYHICAREDWLRGLEDGSYHPGSLETEGFIHCSTASQVAKVANAFYAGRDDLLLLHIDPAALGAPCRYEGPVHPPGQAVPATVSAEVFPHIYGPLNPEAVVEVTVFQPGPGGLFHFA